MLRQRFQNLLEWTKQNKKKIGLFSIGLVLGFALSYSTFSALKYYYSFRGAVATCPNVIIMLAPPLLKDRHDQPKENKINNFSEVASRESSR